MVALVVSSVLGVPALCLGGAGIAALLDSSGSSTPPPAVEQTAAPTTSAPLADLSTTGGVAPTEVEPSLPPEPVTTLGDDEADEIRPGAFCGSSGATGTYRGRTYTCKGPGRDRWRR